MTRGTPPTLKQFPWATSHELRFADLDLLGHVNNGAYMTLMENCRASLLMQPDIAATGLSHFVLAHFEIDFLQDLKWPGQVEATAAITHVGLTSFRMKHAIFSGETCVSHAEGVLVVIDSGSRRPVPLGPDAIAFLQRFWLKAE